MVKWQQQATALDLPFYDIFAPQKASFLRISDDVIVCNFWFAPPNQKSWLRLWLQSGACLGGGHGAMPPLWNLGRKFEHTKGQNLGEDLFFGLHQILGQKPDWFWVEKFYFSSWLFSNFWPPPFQKSCVCYWLQWLLTTGYSHIWRHRPMLSQT